MTHPVTTKQMPSNDNGLPSCHDLAINSIKSLRRHVSADAIISDIALRKQFGLEKYGVPLQPFNGTDQGLQVYQELLDAIPYSEAKSYELGVNGMPDLEDEWTAIEVQLIVIAAKIKKLMEKENEQKL